jgi:hypothetical protein
MSRDNEKLYNERHIVTDSTGLPVELRYYDNKMLIQRIGIVYNSEGDCIGLRELSIDEVIPPSWNSHFNWWRKRKQPEKPIINTIDFIGTINWINTIKTIKTIEKVNTIDNINTIGTINNIGVLSDLDTNAKIKSISLTMQNRGGDNSNVTIASGGYALRKTLVLNNAPSSNVNIDTLCYSSSCQYLSIFPNFRYNLKITVDVGEGENTVVEHINLDNADEVFRSVVLPTAVFGENVIFRVYTQLNAVETTSQGANQLQVYGTNRQVVSY